LFYLQMGLDTPANHPSKLRLLEAESRTNGMDTFEQANFYHERSFSWDQSDGTKVFINCVMRLCKGHKLWRNIFTIEYQFDKALVPRELRRLTDEIDQLIESLKPTRIPD
jgi:hypothetical protein